MKLSSLMWMPFALALVASNAHAQTAPQEPLPRLPPLPPAAPTPPATPPAPTASAAPATPATSTTPASSNPAADPNGFDVQLTANARDMQIHLWTDEGNYLKVCTAPCRAPFLPGKYYFALSEGSGDLVRLDPVDLRGPSRIEATYVSRSGLRLAGLLTFLGSVGAGVAIGIAGNEKSCNDLGECKNSTPTGVGIAALGVALVGGLTGLIMAAYPDKVGIRVTPK